jgi:hypothetical protein
MSKRILFGAMIFMCSIASLIFAATYTVSKDGSGMFTTIQAAINAAQPGDVVKILDAATYPEQVTINGSHSGITLTSANPISPNKPKIVWQDQVNEGPKTCAEAQIDSLITYNQNGALRLMRVHNVFINGIIVDGGGVMPFGSSGAVWPPTGGAKTNCQYPLLHGNAAIILWKAGDIIIRNCEAQNAYFGIYCTDLNEGGVFANANPGDNAPWNVVPLSNFAQTGNHIIEYSRIHNNSWGIFFEAAWDLGSTIRYNLIYENHHNDTIAAQVKALNAEGANQPGAAMFFRDVMLCPLSIHNNTFWHNYLIFCGGFQAGYQHLVFNNIFAKPFKYWSVVPVFSGQSYMDITSSMPDRITNCVYSCQNQAPQTGYISIMNGLPSVQGVVLGLLVPQGSLIQSAIANQPFPATANNRWLEMDTAFFISVDPSSANFLEPNWTDTLVQKYIKNQGWQKSGVKNIDGSWADLGAISSVSGKPLDLAIIKPLTPVIFNSNSATINFSLIERIGKMQNPSIKFIRWISNLQFVAGSWAGGAAAAVVNTANINDIVPLPTPVQVGANTYTITVPAAQTSPYAFFESIIEGTGSDGKLYTTSTGFIPYRKLYYKSKVEVFAMTDMTFAKPLRQITVGDTAILRITPLNVDGSVFTNRVDSVSIRLQSGFKLRVPPYTASDTAIIFPNGITGSTNKMVMFTGIPNGGLEYVYVNGVWTSSTDSTQRNAFPGASNAIQILGGTAVSVAFQNPPSKTLAVSPPPTLGLGQSYSGSLFVYDKYGNKAGAPASVTLSSLTPSIANFVGGNPDLTINTDSTGSGHFSIATTNAAIENSLVSLKAVLSTVNALDTAYMIVGKTTGAKNNPNFVSPGKRHINITCFDLQGRLIFHVATESYSGSIQVKDFQHLWKNKIASGAFIVRMSIKEGQSKPLTTLNKMILR